MGPRTLWAGEGGIETTGTVSERGPLVPAVCVPLRGVGYLKSWGWHPALQVTQRFHLGLDCGE